MDAIAGLEGPACAGVALVPSGLAAASVALLSAYGTKDISWGTLGALAHFSTLPIVAMMILLNRYFVQGLTQGVH